MCDASEAVVKEDVLVIGAGFAGLACGLALAEQGLRCRLLEARCRPGGRCWSEITAEGRALELGAEFVHGENVATWRYLRRYGLEADGRGNSPNPGESVLCSGQIYVFVNDELIGPERARAEPNRIFFSAFEHAVGKWISAGTDPALSLGDLFRRHEGDIFANPPTDDERRLCHAQIAEWYAADPDDIGLYDEAPAQALLDAAKREPQLLASDGDEAHWRVGSGYSSLAERMAAELRIDYGRDIYRIDWHDSQKVVHVFARSPLSSPLDDDGKKSPSQMYQASRVVVTLPLSCLQAKAIQFNPNLPPEKHASIYQLGAGLSWKICLEYSEPFWPGDFQFLFTPFSIQVWWPGPTGSKTLVGYSGGATATRTLLTGKADDEVLAEAHAQLKTMFGGVVSDRYVHGKVLRWNDDRWARMGYSYCPAGCPLEARLDLRAPVGNLFWAGEACHPTKSASVHGALESGEYAAANVCESFQIQIVDLRETRRDLLPEVYRELLETHFPVEGELDELEDMEAGLEASDTNRPELHVLVAICSDDTLCGCACYEYYPLGNFCLLSYICVAHAFRRQGIARRFMLALEAQTKAQKTYKQLTAVFAETHCADVEDGIMDPRERQEVLAALGFRCLQFDYIQPPLSDHQEPCGGLRLLVKDQSCLHSEVIVEYLDNFAGSVMGWEHESWKQEPYYKQQVKQLLDLPYVNAVSKRPW